MVIKKLESSLIGAVRHTVRRGKGHDHSEDLVRWVLTDKAYRNLHQLLKDLRKDRP